MKHDFERTRGAGSRLAGLTSSEPEPVRPSGLARPALGAGVRAFAGWGPKLG